MQDANFIVADRFHKEIEIAAGFTFQKLFRTGRWNHGAFVGELVKAEPYMDADKKKNGRLNLQVVIKNTAHEPRAYQLFGQGKTDTGGWLGGATEAPSKGRLDPGKETTAKVQTSFEGKSVPDEIRLDIF